MAERHAQQQQPRGDHQQQQAALAAPQQQQQQNAFDAQPLAAQQQQPAAMQLPQHQPAMQGAPLQAPPQFLPHGPPMPQPRPLMAPSDIAFVNQLGQTVNELSQNVTRLQQQQQQRAASEIRMRDKHAAATRRGGKRGTNPGQLRQGASGRYNDSPHISQDGAVHKHTPYRTLIRALQHTGAAHRAADAAPCCCCEQGKDHLQTLLVSCVDVIVAGSILVPAACSACRLFLQSQYGICANDKQHSKTCMNVAYNA